MANERSVEAKKEIIRIARFNGKLIDSNVERKIKALNDSIIRAKVLQESETSKTSYLLLFNSFSLVKDLIIMSLIMMAAHLFYYSLTINYSYSSTPVSMEANFISSGLGEWLGCLIGAILIRICSRTSCMFFFQFITFLSFSFQVLIDSNMFPILNSALTNTINNAVGTFATLSTVFVVLIVNQEVFPTTIRQTGSSIVNTLGELGSTLAPLLTTLYSLVGPIGVNIIAAIFCLFTAILSFFITETKNLELKDTVCSEQLIQNIGRRSCALELQNSYQKYIASRTSNASNFESNNDSQPTSSCASSLFCCCFENKQYHKKANVKSKILDNNLKSYGAHLTRDAKR